MSRKNLSALVGILVISLAAILFLGIRRNGQLLKEKEMLILQYDSLHSLELRTRNRLLLLEDQLDSLAHRYGYKYLTVKSLKYGNRDNTGAQ